MRFSIIIITTQVYLVKQTHGIEFEIVQFVPYNTEFS